MKSSHLTAVLELCLFPLNVGAAIVSETNFQTQGLTIDVQHRPSGLEGEGAGREGEKVVHYIKDHPKCHAYSYLGLRGFVLRTKYQQPDECSWMNTPSCPTEEKAERNIHHKFCTAIRRMAGIQLKFNTNGLGGESQMILFGTFGCFYNGGWAEIGLEEW